MARPECDKPLVFIKLNIIKNNNSCAIHQVLIGCHEKIKTKQNVRSLFTLDKTSRQKTLRQIVQLPPHAGPHFSNMLGHLLYLIIPMMVCFLGKISAKFDFQNMIWTYIHRICYGKKHDQNSPDFEEK
jgi:hypothetical protein